ncbi:ATP-grasp domain-containing protein [Variovorax paradoxus]|uniref:ATP-grasp domain-containing protein n=1 Tax=Variovorax paradoxus (strain S110) TaxID=543728 RepID=C5CVD3_VARPS
MSKRNLNTLVLSAGRRVDLMHAFREEMTKRGMSAQLFATDLRPELSAACRVADEAFKVPRVTDPGYADLLLELCLRNDVGLVVPTIDTELLGLAQARETFAEHGVHVVVSSTTLIEQCRDKRRSSGLFAQLDIDTPRIQDKSRLEFPCFAKPFDGSRSIGALMVASQSALTTEMLADSKLMFMDYVDSSHHEYTVDAYYDRSGVLRCLVPRQRLEVRDGEVSKGVTRRDHVYAYLLDRLRVLPGARGCLTIQLFAKSQPQRFAALEINPRFGGGFPLSYAAGARYPGWLIDEYLLGEEVAFFDGWEPNLLMLRYDAKVMVRDYQ